METFGKNQKEELAIIKAKFKAKKLREFYEHVRTYLMVHSLFALFNFMTSPGDWWVLYPLFGWGFCLTIHAMDVFSPFKDRDDEWEERKTRELIEIYKNK